VDNAAPLDNPFKSAVKELPAPLWGLTAGGLDNSDPEGKRKYSLQNNPISKRILSPVRIHIRGIVFIG